jgi:hypothetical protein
LAVSARRTGIIWSGTLLVVGMALYPPWTCVGTRGIGWVAGYHWFFAPPDKCVAANLDFPRLLMQWVVVAVLASALYLAWPQTLTSQMSKMSLRTLKILVAFVRLVLTSAPLLILAGVCLGLLYFSCMSMQPWIESVLPVRVVPTAGRNWPWLFIYVLLIVAFIGLFIAALVNEIKEISGRPLRRLVLGLWSLVKSIYAEGSERPKSSLR